MAVCACLAQSDRGTLTGRILDPSSGVIPNAHVVATHQATQGRYPGVTNEAGIYSLQQLPIGRYDVAVEAPGFRRYVRKDVEVNVAQTMTLNINLEVGQVDQTVEVTAAAATLETSTSDLGTVVSRERVMDLPLSVSGNMRNPEQFIFLAPGVTGDTGNTQINGSQSRAKEVLVDGVGSTSPESGGLLFTYPSVEAIAEFKLVRNNFNAEYGRTGGGFEVFTTKSGSNDFHGSVFDYLRNDVFDARGFYARSTPVNRQNEYGASIGGPILIPRLYNGKNRSFFNVVYSGFRFRQGAANVQYSIPPAEFRTGDFSRLNRVIYDPRTTASDGAGGFTRQPFAGNRISQDRFSAVARNILPILPAPSNGDLLNNFLSIGAARFDRDQINVKIDHALSDKSRLSGFLYFGTQTGIGAEGLPIPLTESLDDGRKSRWVRLTHDYIFTPNVLNHFNAGFTREGQYWSSLAADQDWPNKVGLKGVNTGAGNTFPLVSFTNGYTAWANTNGGKTVGSQVNNAWQASDSLSWVRGSHSFKFGGEGRWMQTNGADFFNSQGRFAFSSFETALPTAAGRNNSGDGFASFLLGEVDNGLMQVLAVVPGNRYKYLATYFQDDWKATRRLTINYGFRYEIYFPRSEKYLNLSSFDPTLPNPAAGGRLGAISFLGDGPGRSGLRSFADTDYKDFGPRLGFAYSVSDKMVIRTGYGIYFAPGNATAGLRSSQAFGFGFNASPSPASTDTGVTPAFNWDNGFPQNFPRPPLIDAVANGTNVNMIGRGDGRPPYFQNWTFSVQRELPARFLLELAYVGTKGTRLGNGLASLNELDPSYLALGSLLSRPIDSAEARAANIPIPYPGFRGSVAQALRPYPQFLNISQRSNPNGNSTYHAFQMQAEKRLSYGLTYLMSYTWAKTISDGDVQAGGGPGGQTYYNRRLEKGVSTNDVPHVAAISYLYELPFGPGRRFLTRGAGAKLVGGWTLTGIHQYQSGRPIGISAQNTLPLFNGVLRPDVVSGVSRRGAFDDFDPGRDVYINPAAFAIPAPLTFGTAARAYTDLRTFAFYNESFGAIKRTTIGERLTLTFRAEFFNVFNRVVFAAPAANRSNSNFGRVSAQSNSPRQGQLALKLEF
jgi:carboxypeptidase family protein